MERRSRILARLAGFAAALLFGVASAHAQCVLTEVFDPAGSPGDEFGHSVAFDGVHAVVGVPSADEAVLYRFDGTSWSAVTTLSSALTTPNAEFGRSVDIDGTWIAVGAPSDDGIASDAGAVVVFRFDGSGWSEEAKITASDAQAGDRFGEQLIARGDTMIVANRSVANPSVYDVRRRSGAWVQVDQIPPTPPVAEFATDVAFDGRRLVIASGAPSPRVDFYFWQGGGWVLTDSEASAGPNASVDLSGHFAAVGAPSDGNGSVTIFRYDSLDATVDQVLVGSVPGGQFGAAVGLRGDTLVVGDPAGTGSAVAYRRESAGWVEQGPLEPSSPTSGAAHGAAVALHGDLAVVGAPQATGATTNAGAVSFHLIGGSVSAPFVRAGDPRDSAWFGWWTGGWGSRIVFTAPNASGATSAAGAAYLQRLEGGEWLLDQKLFASDGTNDDNYGASAGVHGFAAAVAADLRNGREGATYLYRHDGSSWVEEQIVVGSGAVGQDDEFGRPIELDGDVLAATCVFDDDEGEDAGAVYLFEYDPSLGTWAEVDKLAPDDLTVGASFGSGLDLDGNLLVAAGPNFAGTVSGAGKVYIYRFDGTDWLLEQTLEDDPPALSARYGFQVRTWGGWIAVSARQADTPAGTDSGKVVLYRFDGDQWVFHEELVPRTVGAFDQVGAKLGIDGGLLATYAPGTDLLFDNVGTVFTYRWTGSSWVEGPRIESPRPEATLSFGNGLSVHDGRVVIGGPFEDHSGIVNPGAGVIASTHAALCDPPFVRGDANQDGVVEISDVVAILDHLFEGATTTCEDAFDVNADQSLSISDAFQAIYFLFGTGEPYLFAPYPNCGTNLVSPGVGCDLHGACP